MAYREIILRYILIAYILYYSNACSLLKKKFVIFYLLFNSSLYSAFHEPYDMV